MNCKGTGFTMAGSTLKLIAIITMLIDHIATVLLFPFTYDPTVDIIYNAMRHVGRISFPLFGFLATEGVVHTRNKIRYVIQLFLFALFSEIPFDLAFFGTAYYPSYQNVYFTLGLGVAVAGLIDHLLRNYDAKIIKPPGVGRSFFPDGFSGVLSELGLFFFLPCLVEIYYGTSFFIQYGGITDTAYQVGIFLAAQLIIYAILRYYTKERKRMRYILSVSCMALFFAEYAAQELLHTDYGSVGVALIVLIYVLRARGDHNFRAGLAGICLLIVMAANESFALLAAPLMGLYNGKRGLKVKYFFYLFYPCHLLMLAYLAKLWIY